MSEATFVDEQTRPQAPQFEVSYQIACSQPLSSAGGLGPSQSLTPGVQSWAQNPFEHVCFALLVVLQAALHAPQCCGSVGRTSQPLVQLTSQFLNPVLQV
jgi:hypothetical protein